MKKTLLIAFLLTFGIAFQTSAANSNSQSQGSGTSAAQNVKVPASASTQGSQTTGNTVKTDEQNRIMNQGETNQIQTQEQNAVQTQDKTGNGTNPGKGKSTSEQRRSQVAAAVQAMLQIAERNGGIGQQVRTIAQNQNQNQEKLEKNMETIQSRSGLAKFFVGPNYGEIKDAQKTLEQNKAQIRQMNQIRTQLSNQGDQQQLAEQIKILEQTDQEIETLVGDAQGGFSLFGWLNKIVS
jgi:hypothetical protein